VLSRGGKAVRLSHDHKPVDEEERIRELGGYVIGKTTQRVNGMLGVPRSIGDFFVKPYVSEEPFVNVVPRQADDDFIMLACDGVWDELDDQRVVDICKKETSAQAAAIRVRDYAYMAGSRTTSAPCWCCCATRASSRARCDAGAEKSRPFTCARIQTVRQHTFASYSQMIEDNENKLKLIRFCLVFGWGFFFFFFFFFFARCQQTWTNNRDSKMVRWTKFGFDCVCVMWQE
jgi:hypothetical protein